MDDAATAFATACAVIAASTGMVLCLAPKSANDVVIDEEPTTTENKGVTSEEDAVVSTEETAALTEETMKEEVATEPTLAEEPVPAPDEATNDAIVSTPDAIPEQRPDDMTSPIKKKRRFTLRGDRTPRMVEGKSASQTAKPIFRKSQSMKWLPFRPNSNKKNEAVNVGQEV